MLEDLELHQSKIETETGPVLISIRESSNGNGIDECTATTPTVLFIAPELSDTSWHILAMDLPQEFNVIALHTADLSAAQKAITKLPLEQIHLIAAKSAQQQTVSLAANGLAETITLSAPADVTELIQSKYRAKILFTSPAGAETIAALRTAGYYVAPPLESELPAPAALRQSVLRLIGYIGLAPIVNPATETIVLRASD